MSITDFLRARYAEERRIGEMVQRSSLGPSSLILRDLDAKLAIVAGHANGRGNRNWPDTDYCTECQYGDPGFDLWPCDTLRHLAGVYSTHPDYRQEWKP